mmetsp:Transcript_6854/g.8694  ORF Transcript_6854/g.8694 Transcript_6854/m.8694 type:complete len:412 (-) Transcript_6854:6161-7396(-)
MSTEPPNHIPDSPNISMINKRNANINNINGLDQDNNTNRVSVSRLSTPISTRPNSSTNLPSLTTKVHLKRPKLGDRTGSTESIIRTPVSLKASNRFTIQTNARAANGTPTNIPNASTPIRGTSGSNVSGFASTPALTSLDMGKKRLVDQFYSTYKEPQTSSGTDLTQYFRNGTNASPSTEKTFRFSNYVAGAGSTSEDSLPSDIISDLVQSGGFTYTPAQNHPSHDESLTDQLLNIDSLAIDPENPNVLANGLAEISLSLSSTLLSHTRDSFALAPANSHASHAAANLDALSCYLKDVRRSTIDILAHLDSNKDYLKEKFRADINNSVSKLDEIVTAVSSLEYRLNYVRSKVNRNKRIMSQDLSPKIALLENIDKRMAEYANSSRKRHLRQISTVSILLVVLILLYMLYIR